MSDRLGASLVFLRPTPQMAAEVLAFKERFFAAGEQVINGSGGLDFYPDVATWLAYLARVRAGEEEGFVPSDIWFARAGEDGPLVGILDIRPTLPPKKMCFGHMGYAVVPGERNKGVAGAMVAWGVRRLRDAGVDEVLACCYEDNEPSRRTLEKNGFTKYGFTIEEETGKTILQYKNVEETGK